MRRSGFASSYSAAHVDSRPHSIGEALIDAIDELINQGRIEPQLAMKILSNFDRAIAENLAANVKSRLNFKVCSSHLVADLITYVA